MSDFFGRLAARSVDSMPVVLPRIASRYATPNWAWSPEMDADLAGDARPEQPHEHNQVPHSPPLPPPTQQSAPRAASPSSSNVVDLEAVDARQATLHSKPIRVAVAALLSGSPAAANAVEGGHEGLAVGDMRSEQSASAPLVSILDTQQTDQPADARAPAASTMRAGIVPTTRPQPPQRFGDANDQPAGPARVAPPLNDQEPPRALAISSVFNQPAPPRLATLDSKPDLVPDTPPAPEIHVSIGRIEVRAVMPPVAQTPRASPPANRPALSLEAYLEQRRQNSR
jgi:hypothetical protein